MNLFAGICATAALAMASAAGAARAQHATLDDARAAILSGRYDGALAMMEQINAANVDQNDLDFLRGTALVGKGDYAAAIAHFRAVLARDPSLNRVRLDLAQAYFRRGDDWQAEQLFRAALAEDMPSEVRQNVESFLEEIRRRRRWDLTVSAGIAPDTNVNTATTAQSIDIFGLPFQLDPAARQTSGIGFSAALSGSYQWPLAQDVNLRAGGTYYAADYSGAAFDDHNLGLFIGPRFLLGSGTEASTFMTATKRWFGNKPFSEGLGARLEAQTLLTPRTFLSGTIFGQRTTYDGDYASYSGPQIGASAALTYAWGASRSVRGLAGIVREYADVAALRSKQYTAGVGYFMRDLPFKLSGYAEVRATHISYDQPLAAFGVRRKDLQMDYRFSFSMRGVAFHGFTPTFGYVHTNRDSNITLYRYKRDRFELGLTRSF
jgi:tetratricopeptide (TPR) repeat protein